MRKIVAIVALSLVALSLSGCGCNRTFSSWFNRGDSCAPPNPCATAPTTTLFGGGQIPPGVEMYPANP